MTCQYFAPNGKPSRLFDQLYQEYGQQIAVNAWLYTKSKIFKTEAEGAETDANGEVTIDFLKSKGLVDNIRHFLTATREEPTFHFKAESLKRAFVVKGVKVNIVED